MSNGGAAIFAAVRVCHALFFGATTAYCVLNYNTFTYEQFIRPQMIGWLPQVAATHHELYWLFVIPVLATLVAQLRRRNIAAWSYAVAAVGVGGWLTFNPIMAVVGNDTRSYWLGVASLVPVIWLALVDHLPAPRLQVTPVSEARLFRACLVAALGAWVVYAALAPVWMRHASGAALGPAALALAWLSSLAAHVVFFGALYAVLAAALAAVALTKRAALEYWAVFALATGGIAVVTYRLVGGGLSFQGGRAWLISALIGVAIALTWSAMALRFAAGHATTEAADAFDVWQAPLAPRRFVAIGAVTVVPLAYLLVRGVAEFDWDFLFQKIGVLVVWFVIFGCAWAAAKRTTGQRRSRWLLNAAPAATVVVVALTAAPLARHARAWSLPGLDMDVVLDRYEASDASFHLIRDVLRSHTGEAATFYSFLKTHSGLRALIKPIDIDFDRQLSVPTGREPHVFVFIVDSLRRDYLSPYNATVDFTPGIAALASDSFVFERAFTRYGGTALSVPSIYTGGMVIHKQYVTPYAPMNTLEKLLVAKGYQQYLSPDHIVTRLFEETPTTVYLDARDPLARDPGHTGRGGRRPELSYTVCGKTGELRDALVRRTSTAPVFAMTRTLDLHLTNVVGADVPDLERIGDFSGPYAARVQRLDGCLGDFVEYLKEAKLYENSVIVLTADHGESVGDENRWGHAYTLYPEVVQIPLIVHVPDHFKEAFTTDLGRLAFSTDITPTLYTLLGEDPADLGPLYGAPLLSERDSQLRSRSAETFVLSSSYGPVFGLVSHGGRQLYIADAIDGRDYAYDLTDPNDPSRITITSALREFSWARIREQVSAIAAQYDLTPHP